MTSQATSIEAVDFDEEDDDDSDDDDLEDPEWTGRLDDEDDENNDGVVERSAPVKL